jgi:hypothetical protein
LSWQRSVVDIVHWFQDGTPKNLYMRHSTSKLRSSSQLGRTRSMEDFAVPSNIVYASWHDPAS